MSISMIKLKDIHIQLKDEETEIGTTKRRGNGSKLPKNGSKYIF